MSYLVMECHPGYAVLLDEEGRFLRAANLQYEIGQTVYDPVLMKDTQERKPHAMRWISSGIAAIAACFLLFFGISYYQNNLQPYSSIYLTINPEVQMDLNRKGTVVGLTGTNEDGKALLEGYDGKGKDKVTVADELIDRAIEMGFLSEGGRVSFSIDSPDEVLFQEYGTELRAKVTEHLDGRITITIEIINHKDRQNQESSENSSSSNATDYDDTDYGANNNDAADDTLPSASAPPANTDYGPGSNGVTDYTDGDTDYDPENDTDDDSDDDGDSGYGINDSDDDGNSGYGINDSDDDSDNGHDDYDSDDDGDSGYATNDSDEDSDDDDN